MKASDVSGLITWQRRARHISVAATLSWASAVMALGAVMPNAWAQTYPAKAITVVLPIGPNTAFFVALRQMADQMQEKIGKPIIFETAIGASGTLAPARVKRAEADGHTIGLTFSWPMTVDPYVRKEQPPYDVLKDFSYITMLTRHGVLFVAGAKVPANTVQELIALAKAKPGTVKVGVGATGSRVGLYLLQDATGVQFFDVPYKSSADFPAALLSGEIDLAMSTAGTEIGMIRSGRTKAMFIGSRNRSSLLPSTQSITEVYPNVEIISWYGLYAPTGTPQDRITWLHREWTTAIKDPKIVEKMQTIFGYEIVASTPQEMLDQIKREIPESVRIGKQYKFSD